MFHKATTGFTLRAETATTSQYRSSETSLGVIVGWLDTFVINERLQGGFEFQSVFAGVACLVLGKGDSFVQELENLGSNRLDLRLKI